MLQIDRADKCNKCVCVRLLALDDLRTDFLLLPLWLTATSLELRLVCAV